MGITTGTRDKVSRVLQARGVGRGLTIPQLRRAYPAKAVRRTAILEALADLEAMGKVAWNGQRVRWTSTDYDVDRVLGEEVDRIERDRARSPSEGGSIAAGLSNALIRSDAS